MTAIVGCMICEPWPILWPCNEDGEPAAPTADEALIAAAQDLARTVLWSHTGRRLGQCQYTAETRFVGPSGCTPGGGGRKVWLPVTPVSSVDRVVIDGVAARADAFSVSGSTVHIETVGTHVVVEYTAGVPLGTLQTPTGLTNQVAAAMGEVATEFLKGMCGGQCRLPARAQTVTRQGVTVSFAEPERIIELGLLGLPVADALIRTLNPERLSQRSAILSPDSGPAR